MRVGTESFSGAYDDNEAMVVGGSGGAIFAAGSSALTVKACGKHDLIKIAGCWKLLPS